MLKDIIIISLSLSPFIALFSLLAPLVRRRFGAKWMRLVRLILALRLALPFRLTVALPAETRISDPGRITAYTEKYVSALDAPIITASSPVPVNNITALSPRDLLPLLYIAAAAGFFLWHIASYLIFTVRIRPCLQKKEKYRGIWVCTCQRCASPMLIGFIFPKIILPDEKYTDKDKSLVLKHEYSHFIRGDMWYKLLLCFVCSLHIFNPLVHIMRLQANRDIEYSCDEYVTKNTDISFRRAYSMAILNTIPKGEEK